MAARPMRRLPIIARYHEVPTQQAQLAFALDRAFNRVVDVWLAWSNAEWGVLFELERIDP